MAAKANARKAFGRQDILLGDGHFGGFAFDELDFAGRAAGVAAAGMELVDLGFVNQGQNKAFAFWDFKFAYTIDSQFGHFRTFPNELAIWLTPS